MWEKLRVYGLVTLITLLIWTWAERESLRDSRIDGRIEVVPAESREVSVRPADPQWRGSVRISLKGSNAAIDAASRVLTSTVRLTPGIGGVPAASGEQVIDLREALREHADLRRLGVTITEVEPASMRVIIEELVTRTVGLRLSAPGVSLDGEPTFAVGSVQVKLPASAAPRITEGTVAPATLDEQSLLRLSDEQARTVTARVSAPESLVGVSPVLVNPETVQVTVKLKGRRETMLLSEVPVVIALPPGEAARWTVEALDASVKNVVASGPRESIEPLRAGRERPRAVVVLSKEDLERRADTATAVIVGGNSASAVRFEAAELTVHLKISPK